VGAPLDLLGGGLERLTGRVNQTENGQRGIRERGECLCQAGPGRVVTVLIPPAVLDEVQAVFHLPVAANVLLEIGSRDGVRIETGHEIPALTRNEFALGATDFAINSDGDATFGNVQTLPNVLGIVEADPKPACLLIEPLFSILSSAGGLGGSWKKQASRASSMSGWFALT